MCLIKFKEVTLDRDIIVYKFLRYMEGYEDYLTPYQRDIVGVPSKVYSKVVIDVEFREPVINRAIHSFASIEDAIEEALEAQRYYKKDYVIVRCMIPKGAKVYKGNFEGSEAYASSELHYLNVVLTFDYADVDININKHIYKLCV